MSSDNSNMIRLCVSGNNLSIDGPRSSELKLHPVLRFTGPGGTRFVDGNIVRASRDDFEAHFLGRPSAGLWRVLGHLADEMHLVPEVVATSFPPLGMPQPLANRGPADSAFVRFIAEHDCGLIRTSPNVNVARLIAQAALSFPTAKIAIVLRHRRMIDTMAAQLTQFGLFEEEQSEPQPDNTPADEIDARPRICIGTVGDFVPDNLDIQRNNIVFFPNADDALSESGSLLFLNPDNRFRFIGFISAGASQSAEASGFLRGTFGFDELTIPDHGYETLPIRISWIPFISRSVSQNIDPSRMHTFIWRNRKRNKFIASLARKSLPTNRERESDTGETPYSRTVIVATSIAHALALHDYLPAWPLIASIDTVLDDLTDEARRAIHAGHCSQEVIGDRAIATVDGLQRMNGASRGDLLIWAGGGDSGLEVPLRLGRREQSSGLAGFGPHIVDLEDDGHHLLRQATRRRRACYLMNDYLPLGFAADARALNFLARKRLENP